MNLANIVPATLGEDGDPLDILVLMMRSYHIRDGRSARSGPNRARIGSGTIG